MVNKSVSMSSQYLYKSGKGTGTLSVGQKAGDCGGLDINTEIVDTSLQLP